MIGNHLIHLETAVFEPNGYITSNNVSDFQKKLNSFISNSVCKKFLVDMRQVEFIDSTGLIAIVSAFRLAQRLNKKLSVCSLSPSVRIIFELTQLDQALEIYDDRQVYIHQTREAVGSELFKY